MEKDFDKWNEKKKNLDIKNNHFFFREREIWWCSVGLNIGTESYGKGESFQRPVLILKKLSDWNFIGIPLSTKQKKGSWYIDIQIENGKRTALLYQVKMFSTNRLQRKISALQNKDFIEVKRKLKQLLELS